MDSHVLAGNALMSKANMQTGKPANTIAGTSNRATWVQAKLPGLLCLNVGGDSIGGETLAESKLANPSVENPAVPVTT